MLLWVDCHVEVGEGGDAGGGESGAGGGECDAVDVEGVTDGTAVMLSLASTCSTSLGWIINTRGLSEGEGDCRLRENRSSHASHAWTSDRAGGLRRGTPNACR